MRITLRRNKHSVLLSFTPPQQSRCTFDEDSQVMSETTNRSGWICRSFSFIGEVQQQTFRRSILRPIHAFGLGGWIGNDQHDRTKVNAILCGRESDLFTFIEVTEHELNASGVRLVIHEDDVSPQVVPLPAVRLPNSGHDVEDRFDTALDILRSIDGRLGSIDLKLERVDGKLERMDGKLENMDGKLDSLVDICKKIDKNISGKN